jgi:hypothetical protein
VADAAPSHVSMLPSCMYGPVTAMFRSVGALNLSSFEIHAAAHGELIVTPETGERLAEEHRFLVGEQPLVFQIAFQPPDEIVRRHRRIEFRQREHLQRRPGVASRRWFEHSCSGQAHSAVSMF